MFVHNSFSIQGGRLWLGAWLSLGGSGAQMCFPLLWCTTQFNYTFVVGVASLSKLTLLWLSLPLQELVMLGRMSGATTAILLFVRLTTTRRLTSSQWLLINLDFLSSRLFKSLLYILASFLFAFIRVYGWQDSWRENGGKHLPLTQISLAGRCRADIIRIGISDWKGVIESVNPAQ